MIVAFLPLCKGCFLQIKSGKLAVLELRDGLGSAKYNTATSKIDFPPGVPKSRLPGNRRGKAKEGKKVLMARIVGTIPVLVGLPQEVPEFSEPDQPLSHDGGAQASYNGPVDSVMEREPIRCLVATSSLRVTFFVDSGAGQCLCSDSTAFSELQPCRIEVTGVSGSLPIYGCGTANFVALDHNGKPLIIRIPNCLYGRCEFNLLSVSQLNQVNGNRVDFSLGSPAIVLVPPLGVMRSSARVPLVLEDGLYALHLEPLGEGDSRFETLPKYTATLKGKFVPSNTGSEVRWEARMLATGSSTACLLGATSEDCHDQLGTFCDQYLAPPSIPPARRLYDIKSQEDMAQLSIRFLGASTDRLIRTVDISNGLKSPASKRAVRVPPLNFPQGRLKKGKSPKVSKGKVGNLKRAGIGEVVFSDTLESGDSRRKYGQVFYDYVSRYGFVVVMRSKTEIGDAFAEFCCQCWVPLILVRDNAGENVGGSLIQELRNRNVKSAFICPHRSQQNFAEGFIGRITVMASFAMVFSGAPLFMWVHAILAATFINNITATYFAKISVWATPYELVHGERFPGASVVVPFGCGALILLDDDEQAKFKSTPRGWCSGRIASSFRLCFLCATLVLKLG